MPEEQGNSTLQANTHQTLCKDLRFSPHQESAEIMGKLWGADVRKEEEILIREFHVDTPNFTPPSFQLEMKEKGNTAKLLIGL